MVRERYEICATGCGSEMSQNHSNTFSLASSRVTTMNLTNDVVSSLSCRHGIFYAINSLLSIYTRISISALTKFSPLPMSRIMPAELVTDNLSVMVPGWNIRDVENDGRVGIYFSQHRSQVCGQKEIMLTGAVTI